MAESPGSCLVTGASGFVGGHLAESLVRQGWHVRTLVRPTSDRQLLDELGVECFEGDLTDPAALRRAAAGMTHVAHVAAKVGEWGPWADYMKVNVDGLAALLDAVGEAGGCERFVLVSSLGVYPARDHFGTDETCPLPARHIDGYTHSKAEADRLALARRDPRVPLAIVRPGFVYGPRDRQVLPRILGNLRKGRVTFFGSADKLLNQVHVANVVQGIELALTHPAAAGEVFNLRDAELVTKRTFFGTIAELAGLPAPTRTVAYPVGVALTAAMGLGARIFGGVPLLTPARLKFMGLNLDYSIAKATSLLGYAPQVAFPAGIRETMAWLKESGTPW